MPFVVNPAGALIVNWNNKPVSWWPNFDTPAWGRIFRNESLVVSIPLGGLSAQDLERAAWQIARRDETAPYFLPHFHAMRVESMTAAAVWRA